MLAEGGGPARRHRERKWMKSQLEKLEKYREGEVFYLELPDSWEDDGELTSGECWGCSPPGM